MAPIDVRHKHPWICACRLDRNLQLAIDRKAHSHVAVFARRLHFDGEMFASQLPLHEGRRYRVLRSGAVQAFPRAEMQPVRRGVHGHRIGPLHRP